MDLCTQFACAVQVEKNKDNILPRIMAVSGSYDKLFAEELKKYDTLKVRRIFPMLMSMRLDLSSAHGCLQSLPHLFVVEVFELNFQKITWSCTVAG